MTWIALLTHEEQDFAVQGLGSKTRKQPEHLTCAGALLTRGTIMIETSLSPNGKPQDLFLYRGNGSWLETLTFHAIPGGGVTLVMAHNKEVIHATVPVLNDSRTDAIRIMYAWDAQERWARLSSEQPDGSEVQIVELSDPKPIPVADIRAMVLEQNKRLISEDAIFVAVSDRIEPLGPTPTLTGNVPVDTHEGFRSAGTLKRGDLVRTEKSQSVPILQSVHRTVPARGSFAPVRLRAPYFGLRQDIIVAQDQRLVIRGSDVEYLFGREAVLVPARHLVNGVSALRQNCAKTITYCQFILPACEALMAAGTAAESLYIGRIRRKPELLRASLLSDVGRNNLPEHGQSVFPVLRWCDAITLVQQRAA